MEATAASIAGLHQAAADVERPAELGELEITITPPGRVDGDAVKRYEDLGVSRLALLPGRLDSSGSAADDAVRFVEETAGRLGL